MLLYSLFWALSSIFLQKVLKWAKKGGLSMNRIKELRMQAGLTQLDLATKIGLNQTAVGKYERGQLEPSLETLKKLSSIFECSIDYIIGYSDDFGAISIQKEKPVAALKPDEQELLDIYHALEREHQSQILEYARYFATRSKNAKKSI